MHETPNTARRPSAIAVAAETLRARAAPVTRAILAAALLALGLAGAARAQMSPPVPRLPPQNCSAPEHRQFDFWVGAWDVYRTGSDEIVARSLIEKLYGDCAIRESWSPFSLNAGGSLSNYVPREHGWRQTWLDSYNARVEFAGGLEDDRMVLTGLWRDAGGPGKDQLTRMRWWKEAGGTVRQTGEISVDGGKSWAPSFDFTYKPAR
jgi:hypothetical protein